MALLNNLTIFVENEEVSKNVESTSHPVEKGIEFTDHIQRKPLELSISGKIVDVSGMKAKDILQQIEQLKNKGSLITYTGRNLLSDMQIQSFSTTHPNTVWGGCEFSMTLKEVRIAKPAYTEQKNGGMQQLVKGANNSVYHTVKKGDCIWNLVTKQYKSLEPKYSNTMDKCNWVMSQNQSAFSRKGDFRTLQIGKKILIGYRK